MTTSAIFAYQPCTRRIAPAATPDPKISACSARADPLRENFMKSHHGPLTKIVGPTFRPKYNCGAPPAGLTFTSELIYNGWQNGRGVALVELGQTPTREMWLAQRAALLRDGFAKRLRAKGDAYMCRAWLIEEARWGRFEIKPATIDNFDAIASKLVSQGLQ